MLNNPPLGDHQITQILHRTYFECFVGIIVSILAGDWEGIASSAILHCISHKDLNFFLFFTGNKWDYVFFNPFV
jgi:hypothetical protein